MNPTLGDVGGLVEAVRLALAPIPPSRERSLVLETLSLVGSHLDGPGDKSLALAQAHITTASDAATSLVAAGAATPDLLRSIEAVLGAVLGADSRRSQLVRGAGAPPASRILASVTRPRLHEAARQSFDAASVAADEQATSPEAPTDDEVDNADVDPLAVPEAPLDLLSVEAPILPRGPTPPVRIAEEGGEPISPHAFYSDAVVLCLDHIASLARDRRLAPWNERPEVEVRLLHFIDAIAVAARRCTVDIVGYWMTSLESTSPWMTWAAVFALSSLAGDDALEAVDFGLARLPGDSFGRAVVAADALTVAPHPGTLSLARDLLASPSPLSRAVGVDVLSRKHAIEPQELARFLGDPSPSVMAMAARAAGRLPAAEAEPLLTKLQARALLPDGNAAWECSRTLLRWGFREPYHAVQQRTAIVETLGVHALDILVLCGDAGDATLLQHFVNRQPVNRVILDGVARFGHPLTWRLFVHCLGDEELAEAAEDALSLMFGRPAGTAPTSDAVVWRRHIGSLGLDPRLRCRHGRPWKPGMLADEQERLSSVSLESRLDELTVRAGVDLEVDMALWHDETKAQLQEAVLAARRADSSCIPGSWECARR